MTAPSFLDCQFAKLLKKSLVGEFSVRKVEDVDIYVVFDGAKHKVLSLAVDDELKIDINRKNKVNITGQRVNINSLGIVSLLQSVFSSYNDSNYRLKSLDFQVIGDFRGAVLSKGVFHKSMRLTWKRPFSFDIAKLFSFLSSSSSSISSSSSSLSFLSPFPAIIIDNSFVSVFVEEFKVKAIESPVQFISDAQINILFKRNLFKNSTIDEMIWTARVADCENQLTDLFTVKTEQFDPENGLFLLQAKLPRISDKLLATCANQQGISTINEWLIYLLKRYDAKDAMILFLQAAPSKNAQWFSQITSSVNFPLDVNLIKRFTDNQFCADGVSINIPKFEMELPRQVSKNDIIPVVNSEAEFSMQIPSFLEVSDAIDFDASRFSGDMYIDLQMNKSFYDAVDIDFFKPQLMTVNLDQKNRTLAADMVLVDSEIEILNSTVLNHVFLQNILAYQSVIDTRLSPMVSFTLANFNLINDGEPYIFRDVPLSLDYSLNVSKLLDIPAVSAQSTSNLLDAIMRNLVVEIVDLVYLSSGENSLALVLNLQIVTPEFLYSDDTREYKLSTEEIASLVDFHFGYNNSKLGHTILKKFNFNSKELYNNVSMLIDLDPSEFKIDAHAELHELLSRFISNDFPRVDVFGHERSFPSSKKISQVLDGLNVSMILPEYNCPIDSVVPYGRTQSNGFILGVTMHLMTSEIELEVYNPIKNSFIDIVILSGKAIYHNPDDNGSPVELAHLKKGTLIRIPPGVYKTPRLSITYETSGLAGEILRGATNKKLDIETIAEFELSIGNFNIELEYSGDGTMAQIRF